MEESAHRRQRNRTQWETSAIVFRNGANPLRDLTYRVTNDAAHVGIGGTSLGGFAALYVALARPDLFALVLAESPDLLLGNGQLLRDTTLLVRAPDRVAIGVGTTEYNFPQSNEFFEHLRLNEGDAESTIVTMNQELASNLKKALVKASAVKLVIEPGARHSAEYWSRRIPDAITFLYCESSGGLYGFKEKRPIVSRVPKTPRGGRL